MKTNDSIRYWGFILLTVCSTAGPAAADRTIQYQSTLEATNHQSDGAEFDESFFLEVGTFTGGFVPDESNAADWFYHWVAAPNINLNPDSGSLTRYSTESVPFGGPANAFQGFFTLGDNDPGFAPGMQAYFWVFDKREEFTSAEWLLMTNTGWKVPTVVPGEIELVDISWLTSDSGTWSVTGNVNSDFDPEVPQTTQTPHLTSTQVAIPEPGVLALALPAALILMGRRRSAVRNRS